MIRLVRHAWVLQLQCASSRHAGPIMRICPFLLSVFLLAGSRIPAQTPARASAPVTATPVQPAYDVAVIRLNTTGSGNTDVTTRSATLQAQNWALKSLIETAYGVRRNLIFGLPAWAENARYDISAKVLDTDPAVLHNLSPEQRHKMLQSLCEQRFGLKWHFDTRPLPDLELVIAKGGPKLQEVPADSPHGGTHTHNYDLTATAVSIASLIDTITPQLDRPLIDKTGLTAVYSFHLKWTPDSLQSSSDAGESTDAAPSLYTALQEQLGLKLQPGKDPIQTLVIDSISPPSEN